jgi:hypothetical protein
VIWLLIYDRGIGASIASFVERIYVGTSVDQTWISTILSLCSDVELNVAIIVSSGPGFASFTRSQIPALYSIARSFFSSGIKSHDSEAALAAQDNDHACSGKAATIGSNKKKRSLRHYCSKDAWPLKIGGKETMKEDGKIVRTIELNQHVKTASLSSNSTSLSTAVLEQ